MKTLNKSTYSKNYKSLLDKENIPPTEKAYHQTPSSPQPPASLSLKKHSGDNKRSIKSDSKNQKITKRKRDGLSYIADNQINQMIRNQNSNTIIKKNRVEAEGETRHLYTISEIVSPQQQPANINTISRRLKDNMTKVTYRMMASLSQSNQPLYEKLFKPSSNLPSHSSLYKQKEVGGSLSEENEDGKIAVEPMNHKPMDVEEELNSNNTLQIPALSEDFLMPCQSFDTDQQNEFINTWLQAYDTGGGDIFSSSNIYGLECDTFSIVTDQELAESLNEDSNYSFLN